MLNSEPVNDTGMDINQQQFREILVSLLSTDNAVRSKAEEAYSSLSVEIKISHLFYAVQNASLSDDSRQIAAVLLRRLLSNEFVEFYPNLTPECQAQLKEQVLLAVQQNQSDTLRQKICEVAAEVARNLIDDEGCNQWPEFLQFLFQCANSPNVALKESALQMFASVPGVFGNQQNNYLDLIKQMLMQSLAPSEPYEVKFQAVRAVGSFILIHEKETQILKHFSELLAPMLNVIAFSVQQQEDDSLLKVLIELAENTPTYLRPQLLPIYDMCTKIFSDNSILDSWRQLALEVMVTLAEMAPAMVRKHAGKYLEQLVPLILEFMADLEEDSDWAYQDEINDDDNDCNHVVAESALDRFACGLGGKVILPIVTRNIPQMLTHYDWRQRHAALMALSAIGEGCHKQMEAMLEQIMNGIPGLMNGVIHFLQDPDARVRYAACNTIGQMSTDFAPTFAQKFHQTVVPGLMMLLDDNANPRVQAHAGAALVNFAEDCPKHILTPYLNGLMVKLGDILTKKLEELRVEGRKLVLEQIVTTIASVADTAESEFIAYYDQLMPCLKYIIQNATKPELKLLRGKTIECVTLIGIAVGSDKFQQDAIEVMDMLLKTQQEQITNATGDVQDVSNIGLNNLPDDDPQTSYLISAWSRICKVLGKRFEPYLPLVMGPVMKTACMKPDVALLDNEDMQGVEEDEDWQFVSLGEQKNFGIRTAGLEDKSAACMMLVCYARELKEGFADYAEPTVKIMVPMLKFYFHDGVRNAAAESLPWLLECAVCKGASFVDDMWSYICPELLKAIDTEPENDVLQSLLDSMARCITLLGNRSINQQSMTELLRIVDKMMQEHFEREDERMKKHLDEEDYDEIVQEQLEDEESDDRYTLCKIADVIHALFVSYRDQFLTFFAQVAQHFVNLLIPPTRPWSDRQWGVCVFDDLIEFGGAQACITYQQVFLQPFQLYTKDKHPEVRQAVCYGWGVLAQFGGEQFSEIVGKTVPLLIEVIMDAESRDSKNVIATENAISAVTKILKYNSQRVNTDEILPLWLTWLPVVEDLDEASHVYGYLCDMVEQHNPHILGAGNDNIPRIINIVAEAFFREAITASKPEGFRMLNIARHVLTTDKAFFESVVTSMRPELQQALHNALATISA